MDSVKTKHIGEAIDNMTQSEGWKYFEQYLAERESQYTKELKKAKSMIEVFKLQAQLELIEKIRAKITEWIRNKNDAIKNETIRNES